MKGIFRKTLRWLAIVLAAVILLIAAAYGAVQTPLAKRIIAGQVSERVKFGDIADIRIEGLTGWLPFTLNVERLAIGDVEGAWLEAADLRLRWRPMALLSGRIHADYVEAGALDVHRAPHDPDPPEKEPFEAPELPEWWPHIEVDRIEVGQARLGEELVGHYAEYRIQGAAAPPAGRNGLAARLSIERLDGPSERAELSLALLGKPAEVDLQAELIEAEEGGLIATLARLPNGAGIVADLSLRGPLNAITGELTASSAPIGETSLTLEASITEAINLSVDGWTALAQTELPEDARALAEDPITLDTQLRFVPRERVELRRLAVAGAGLDVLGGGSLDIASEETELNLRVSAEELGVFSQLTGAELGGALRVDVELAGPMRHPRGHALIEGRRLRADVARAESVDARLDLESLGELGEGFPGFLATLDGQAAALSVERDTEFLAPADVTLRAVVRAEDPEQYDLVEASLRGEGFQIDAVGAFWPEGLRAVVDATASVEDIAALPVPMDRPELRGPIQVSLHAEGSGDDRSGEVSVEALLGAFPEMPAPLPALMGEETRVDAAAQFADGRLTLESLSAVLAKAELTADGAIDTEGETLDINWTMGLADLAAFDDMTGQRLRGALNAQGNVEGPFDAFAVEATAMGDRIWINDAAIDALSAEATAAGLPDLPAGQASLRLTQDGQSLSARSNYSIGEAAVELADLQLTGPDASIRGDLRYTIETRLATGALTGDIADLTAIGTFIGMPLEGAVQLDASFAAAQGRQQADASLEITGFSSEFASLHELALTITLDDLYGAPTGEAALRASDLRADGGAVVEQVNVEILGGMDEFTAAIDAAGAAPEPFEVMARLHGGVPWPDATVDLTQFEASYAEQKAVLREPSRFTIREDRYTLGATVLETLEGTIRLSGELDAAAVDAAVAAEGLNLARLDAWLPNNIRGMGAIEARLFGPLESPEAEAALTLSELSIEHPAAAELPPATLTAEAALRNGVARASANLSGWEDTALRAGGETPAQLSLAPFELMWDTDTPVEARLDANAELEVLAALLLLDGQSLAGNATAAFTLRGTAANTVLAGAAEVTQGYYEHWELGTVLSAIDVRIATAENRLVIERGQMTDGGAGEVTLDGGVELDAAAGFPFDATVTMNNAYLVRQDQLIAAVSGDIRAAGSTERIDVTGEVTAGPVNVFIPDRLPAAGAPQLEYTEINRPDDLPAAQTDETDVAGEMQLPDPPIEIVLDLRVNMPGRVYVRGRGLDSEWRGNLRVHGPVSAPRINGRIAVARGHFDFLDSRFNLADSQVLLDGGVPITPQLDINAVTRARDITARLRLTGPADNPAIALESEPPLPQDEILARVLFGRNLANITPLQAVRLANAANVLAGGGGALDFMARTRGALGLDQLELRGIGEEDAEATLAFGRYFTDDIYVQMEKGLGAETGKVTVEVEVNPYISVESEVGADAEGGIGVNLKYDY